MDTQNYRQIARETGISQKSVGRITHFILFVDLSTENQINILFVCMLEGDNINYLRKTFSKSA